MTAMMTRCSSRPEGSMLGQWQRGRGRHSTATVMGSPTRCRKA
jgi:hypothetical protein